MGSSAKETSRNRKTGTRAGIDRAPREPIVGRSLRHSSPKLRVDSPLLGGKIEDEKLGQDYYQEAHDQFEFPLKKQGPKLKDIDLEGLIAGSDRSRSCDDWGRSEKAYKAFEFILNLYYRYWFRVEVEGIENVPESGGALMIANHAGAVPPDALMITQAIRNKHPNPRSVYMLAPYAFRDIPILGMFANKVGLIQSHPANIKRLLKDEGRLALMFPERIHGIRKLYWQRYRLRLFGRGSYISTAIKAKAKIVPVAVVGSEEAMPTFAQIPLLKSIAGIKSLPVNYALPHFGLLGTAMYLPAKFKIRFLEPIDLSMYSEDAADDVALVQRLSEQLRTTIQLELEEMLNARRSVWFG